LKPIQVKAQFEPTNARASAFVLCVRCVLPPERGRLGSSVVFVDGGNSFNPYMASEVTGSYGFDCMHTVRVLARAKRSTCWC